MATFWKDCDSDDLILRYNAIKWGLKEKCHVRSRTFRKKNFVIPEMIPTRRFEIEFKKNMEDALVAIKFVLKERGIVRVPKIKLELMTSEAADIEDCGGWKGYKAMKQMMLDIFQ